ncbi:hypothetical protein ACFPOG_12985 [Paenibacillus aestuarii]|uniref:Uncharacterized protein n=1 Tax=Paenibacillus aestuarii TaxID=516965 RepID=A0ABW0K7G5_9BACL
MRRYEELTLQERREFGFIKINELKIKRLSPSIQKVLAASEGINFMPGNFMLININHIH